MLAWVTNSTDLTDNLVADFGRWVGERHPDNGRYRAPRTGRSASAPRRDDGRPAADRPRAPHAPAVAHRSRGRRRTAGAAPAQPRRVARDVLVSLDGAPIHDGERLRVPARSAEVLPLGLDVGGQRIAWASAEITAHDDTSVTLGRASTSTAAPRWCWRPANG